MMRLGWHASPMKPFIVALAVATLSIATLRAEPVFEGYMITGDRPVFMLSDGKEKKSGWLTLGQTFDGFTLISLQPEAETLLVEKDGKRQSLKLREAKVRAAKPESLEARLRSLKGLPLAYELAKLEDKEVNAVLKPLLKRYEEALAVPQTGEKSSEALNWLKAHVERISAQIAARILADTGKASP